MKLRSIAAEERACRKAWKGKRVGTMAWHCHHHIIAEPLTEPAKNRIDYIVAHKPEAERALRLRLFRPVRGAGLAPARQAYNAALASAWQAYNAGLASARQAYNAALASAQQAYNAALASAHAKECRDCPWDGQTIFPEATR